MSATEREEVEVLSAVEVGRIIAVLRNQHVRTRRHDHSGWYRVRMINAGRRYSDEQIRLLLGLTSGQFVACVTAWRQDVGPRWTEQEVQARVLKWAVAHGRWPKKAEFGSDELPSYSSFCRHGGTWALWRALQEWSARRVRRELTPQLILGVHNSNVRRDLVARYGGPERLIRHGGAEQIAKDEYGTLWRMPDVGSGDRVAVYLEVVNATVTNGRREHFFLRVPPRMADPKRAVEWTFNIEGELEGFAAQT